jgi:hypothetical protein
MCVFEGTTRSLMFIAICMTVVPALWPGSGFFDNGYAPQPAGNRIGCPVSSKSITCCMTCAPVAD